MAQIGTDETFPRTAGTEVDYDGNWTQWSTVDATYIATQNGYGRASCNTVNQYAWYRWTQAAFEATSSADYEIRYRVTNDQYCNDNHRAYLRCASGAHTGYFFELENDGPCNWYLGKYINDARTVIANGNFGALSTNITRDIHFKVVGNDLTVIFDASSGSPITIGPHTDTSNQITARGNPGMMFSGPSDWLNDQPISIWEGAVGALAWSTVPDQNIDVGSGTTLNLSNYVTGGTEPYTFSINSGTLPTGLTLQSNGTFTGTTSVESSGALVFDVTDDVSAVEASNSITFTVSSVTNSPPVFIGPNIPDYFGTEGVALNGQDLTSLWSDSDAITIGEVGTWAAGSGASVSSGALVFNEANFVAGTYTLQAKATDTAAQTTNSNEFDVTIAAAPTDNSSVTTSTLHNGAGTTLNSTAVSWIWFPTDIATSLAAADWVSGSGTTSASGTLTTTSTLPAGAGYLLVYETGWAKVYLEALTAA